MLAHLRHLNRRGLRGIHPHEPWCLAQRKKKTISIDLTHKLNRLCFIMEIRWEKAWKQQSRAGGCSADCMFLYVPGCRPGRCTSDSQASSEGWQASFGRHCLIAVSSCPFLHSIYGPWPHPLSYIKCFIKLVPNVPSQLDSCPPHPPPNFSGTDWSLHGQGAELF